MKTGKHLWNLGISRLNRPTGQENPEAETRHYSQENLPAHVTSKDLCRCSTREARACLDFEQAAKYRLLPLGIIRLKGREVLHLASDTAPTPQLISELKFMAGREIHVIAVETENLDRAIFAAYHGDDIRLSEGISDACRKHETGKTGKIYSVGNIIEFRPQRGEAAGMLATLIDYAISHQASDLHLIPRQDGMHLRLRTDGMLSSHEETLCPLSLHNQVINRIKVLSGLDITLHDLPQDGGFSVPAGGRSFHLRVSLMPTVHGEKAVLRFLGCEEFISMESLGIAPEIMFFLNQFMQHNEGALFFAGPTGSGKSTSMYAVIEKLGKRSLSCVSIEDPVEVYISAVSQTSINPSAGLDYASCLRSILRQDPDAILLGEIRDEESARAALQAAITGHLLLTTVHARDVCEVLLRLRNFGVDNLTLGRAVSLIICQKLLPALCEHCRVLDLQAANFTGYEVKQEVGCESCDYSGFSGRVLAAECLHISAALSGKIAAGDFAAFSGEALKDCSEYLPFRYTLEKLLKAGKISMRQFLRHVSSER